MSPITTLNDVVEHLVGVLSEADQSKLKAMPLPDLYEFHHGWGTGIRNQLLLGGQNSPLIADCGSPSLTLDEASMVIITAVWYRLQGQPIESARQPKSFRESVLDSGAETWYLQVRCNPMTGKKRKDSQIYQSVKSYFNLSFPQYAVLAARCDQEHPV